jgi:pentatricopeptide repeat protein
LFSFHAYHASGNSPNCDYFGGGILFPSSRNDPNTPGYTSCSESFLFRHQGYNATISAHENSSHWENAVVLLDSMPAAKLSPDAISYNATISACGKVGQWQAALKIFEAMNKSKVFPDTITYSAAVASCVNGAVWSRALSLFEFMPQANVQPNVICYNVAIGACARSGQWEEALRFLQAMADATVLPNNISYNAAISACEKGRQWQQALRVLDLMQLSKLVPDPISCNAGISACAACGWVSGFMFGLSCAWCFVWCSLLGTSTLRCRKLASGRQPFFFLWVVFFAATLRNSPQFEVGNGGKQSSC